MFEGTEKRSSLLSRNAATPEKKFYKIGTRLKLFRLRRKLTALPLPMPKLKPVLRFRLQFFIAATFDGLRTAA